MIYFTKKVNSRSAKRPLVSNGRLANRGLTSSLQWRDNETRWRLKSPASRLFTQPLVQAQIKENIKAPRHWLCEGNSLGTGEFPAERASDTENVSFWWRHVSKIGHKWRGATEQQQQAVVQAGSKYPTDNTVRSKSYYIGSSDWHFRRNARNVRD